MALVVGNDLEFYRNTGTDASPTWLLVDIIGDVTVNLSVGEAEVDLRVSDWILNLPAKLSGGFDLTLANHIGQTDYDALRTAAFARSQIQFASANGNLAGTPTVGVEYFKAFGFFSEFPWAQPTQEMSSHDASISLGYTEEGSPTPTVVEPAWAVVPAGP